MPSRKTCVALLQLAKILMVRHGFNCTVLFPLDPADDGGPFLHGADVFGFDRRHGYGFKRRGGATQQRVEVFGG
ncbi:MAG TPA: hypothetical protein VKX41_18510 [Alloacidobacterium sp.]|nr:hypothetical protein [Alloacidobacterium sp.]